MKLVHASRQDFIPNVGGIADSVSRQQFKGLVSAVN
ncbi:hypothetical protein AGR13a_Lc30111 [Agrobacterium genomosp. 13 str. CFBP 6927]|uniref:Uncharacterized protein n=1 Tax=Agrobacterium genomosp. 13 str. CFBP 6927 TaxID=1183428 RepID=A0ABM9VLL8_9HYPH|nr:hypothetical protein AGR13a_Lc30111 [Agrobacterium genomosp. 13 str. CFBP 6927]